MGMYGGSAPAPAPPAAPVYNESTREILQAQIDLAGDVYAQEAKWQPKYAELEAQTQGYLGEQALAQASKLYPQVAQIEAQYDAATRAAELQQLQQTLPQYADAFAALTPGYKQATEAAGKLAEQSMQRSLQAPQLTAFESQVGSPYGPAAQRQAQPPMMPAQMPAAQQQSSQYQQAMVQAMQDQINQGRRQGEQTTWQNVARPAYQSTDPNGPAYFAPRAGLAEQMAVQMQGPALPPGSAATLPPPPTSAPMGPPSPVGGQGNAAALFAAQQGATTDAQLQQAQQVYMQAQQGYTPEARPMAQMPPAQGQGLRDTPLGAYLGSVQQFNPINVAAEAGSPYAAARSAGAVPDARNMQLAQSAQAAARMAGAVPAARNIAGVSGPRLQSGLENIDQGTVNQYVSTMPGMADYARKLSQISQQELAAGRGLTAEEERMAQQAARAGYAARGTALGGQSVAAEVLNRADVANRRFQERMGTAAQAAAGIQGVYQPALAQSLQRQQGGLQYGLEAQGQAFGQAKDKDVLAQQLQAQRYSQAMGTQAAGFGQAQAKDTIAQQIQKQRYEQAIGTQESEYSQLMDQEKLGMLSQAQAYEQAQGREQLRAGAQKEEFSQALQRGTAEQQRLQAGTSIQAGQAQLGAGAMAQLQSAQQPVLQAFYNQPILQGAVGSAQQMGLNMGAASGPQLFNPESQTGMGAIYGAYNAQMGAYGAQLQADATKSAGRDAMIGSIIGGGLGAAAAF